MKIEHIAVWVKDLELVRDFYVKYFGFHSNEKYTNKKQFSSYFLSHADGARIELMYAPNISDANGEEKNMSFGYAHLAISAGGKGEVDALTELLRSDGYTVTGAPRTTGDGYYESVILDPEGNQIEITI